MAIVHWASGKTQKEKLKPCPFCGSKELFANETWVCIECYECGILGPLLQHDEFSWDEAFKLWNKRST